MLAWTRGEIAIVRVDKLSAPKPKTVPDATLISYKVYVSFRTRKPKNSPTIPSRRSTKRYE